MIKSSELRHMNLHWLDGRVGCLALDDNFSFSVAFHDASTPLSSFSASQIKPLFITPALLKEAGFTLKAEIDDPLYTGWFFKDIKQYRMKVWKEDYESTYRAAIAGSHFINLSGIHQLQNICFDFTQQELLTEMEIFSLCQSPDTKFFGTAEPNGY